MAGWRAECLCLCLVIDGCSFNELFDQIFHSASEELLNLMNASQNTKSDPSDRPWLQQHLHNIEVNVSTTSAVHMPAASMHIEPVPEHATNKPRYSQLKMQERNMRKQLRDLITLEKTAERPRPAMKTELSTPKDNK